MDIVKYLYRHFRTDRQIGRQSDGDIQTDGDISTTDTMGQMDRQHRRIDKTDG